MAAWRFGKICGGKGGTEGFKWAGAFGGEENKKDCTRDTKMTRTRLSVKEKEG